jgi:hypothetical protein
MSSTSSSGPITMTAWARRQAPHLDVVSASVPEPTLRDHNVVALCDSPERARELVLAWERIEPADGAVGTVVLGTAPDRPSEIERPTGVDPEGVTGHAAGRALRGALPGAVVGALVVAAIVLILDGWSGAVVGAALGGAAFGSVAGAFVAYTKGTGWGAAYEHAFVDPDATAVVFASIHSTERDRIDDAIGAAREHGFTAYCINADGLVESERTSRR